MTARVMRLINAKIGLVVLVILTFVFLFVSVPARAETKISVSLSLGGVVIAGGAYLLWGLSFSSEVDSGDILYVKVDGRNFDNGKDFAGADPGGAESFLSGEYNDKAEEVHMPLLRVVF